MFSKFKSEELCNYFKEQVKNQNEEVKSYYQKLDILSEKPYVVHKKTNQITAVLRGKGVAILDGESVEIEENDVLLLSRNTKHSFASKSPEIELFHIHIPLHTIEEDREILREN